MSRIRREAGRDWPLCIWSVHQAEIVGMDFVRIASRIELPAEIAGWAGEMVGVRVHCSVDLPEGELIE
jgi:hypothetical protein